MNLERFIEALGPAEVVHRGGRTAPVDVLDLAYDTRSVSSGTLFFCVRGSLADGHAFAPSAAAAGAVALVVFNLVAGMIAIFMMARTLSWKRMRSSAKAGDEAPA